MGLCSPLNRKKPSHNKNQTNKTQNQQQQKTYTLPQKTTPQKTHNQPQKPNQPNPQLNQIKTKESEICTTLPQQKISTWLEYFVVHQDMKDI